MSESAADKFIRVQMMASDDDTWDLSDNDVAALQYVVERITALEAENRELRAALNWATRVLSDLAVNCRSCSTDSRPPHLIPNELCPSCIIGGQGVIKACQSLLAPAATQQPKP